MMRFFSLAVVFMLPVVLFGCKQKPPPPPAAPPTPAVTVKAKDLLDEYSTNALAADGKYKGKLIVVVGKFVSAQKAPLLGYAAQVVGEDQDFTASNVQCFLLESAQDEVAKLQPGAIVKMQGTCDGQVLAQVKMSKCSLVK